VVTFGAGASPAKGNGEVVALASRCLCWLVSRKPLLARSGGAGKESWLRLPKAPDPQRSADSLAQEADGSASSPRSSERRGPGAFVQRSAPFVQRKPLRVLCLERPPFESASVGVSTGGSGEHELPVLARWREAVVAVDIGVPEPAIPTLDRQLCALSLDQPASLSDSPDVGFR
jgi:hypothetical protein